MNGPTLLDAEKAEKLEKGEAKDVEIPKAGSRGPGSWAVGRSGEGFELVKRCGPGMKRIKET